MTRIVAQTHLAAMRLLAGRTTTARRDRGATAVEYALIIVAIMVVIIIAVALLGSRTSALFNKAVTGVPTT